MLIDNNLIRVKVKAGAKAAPIIPTQDYVMVDDEIVWLPAPIEFQPEDEYRKGPRGFTPPPGELKR